MKIRKAAIQDVKSIHSLINHYAREERMLPRSMNEIYENIRDHTVCEDNNEIVGVCALHVLWEDLGEIRSLAVRRTLQGHGIGQKLVKRSITEAKRLGLRRIFVLTYSPDFFRSLGFKDVDKSELPHKVWGDCLRCHKFPDCDESALIMEI